MILYYVLLFTSYINHSDDVFGKACLSILNSFKKIHQFSIARISEVANVSNATISRLARILDYSNFNDFSGHLDQIQNGYLTESQILSEKNFSSSALLQSYNQKMKEELDKMTKQLDINTLNRVVETMKESKRILFLGFPLPQSVFLLQMELGVQGKEIVCYSYPEDQIHLLNNIKPDDFILLYDLSTQESLLPYITKSIPDNTKSVLITCHFSRQRICKPTYVLSYESDNFAISNFLADFITEYMRLLLQQ